MLQYELVLFQTRAEGEQPLTGKRCISGPRNSWGEREDTMRAKEKGMRQKEPQFIEQPLMAGPSDVL